MRETLGGTCLNVGCIPSKALLHTSLELVRGGVQGFRIPGIGIDAPARKINLPQMMQSKAESVTALTKGVEFLFRC